MKDQGILLLFLIVFLYKFATLGMAPFLADETLYAEMIAEEGNHISFLPDYLGYPAPWKPGLYFIAYSFFVPPGSAIFGSLEYIYRFPNLIFGLMNAYLVYLIARRFEDRATALATAFFFYASFVAIFTEGRLLMEPFMMAMVLLSLYFYVRKEGSRNLNFAAAGAFALAAALTKSVIALMVPVLAVAYVLQFERKNIANPVFLASLLAVPLGLAVFWVALDGIGMAREVFFIDTGKMFLYDYVSMGLHSLGKGIYYGVLPMLFIVVISFMGLKRHWKENWLFSAWYALSLVPILSSFSAIWYFYYIVPGVAFFAAKMLWQKEEGLDKFAMFILCIYAIGYMAYAYYSTTEQLGWGMEDGKRIGLMLSGKENVLFFGTYYPNTVSVAYKVLSERQATGAYKDFGYVLFGNGIPMPDGESLRDFTYDYYNDKYEREEGFGRMFWEDRIFFRRANPTDFEYVVVTPKINATLEGYEVYYDGLGSTVFRKTASGAGGPGASGGS
ncbi:MAG: glycosyltransferase family 39 protein [Candidatus Micrarchaeota archaeon]